MGLLILGNSALITQQYQEIIDRKLEMRVDALEEAIIHIETELQALKVKMALSCHADYRWICVISLKVNKTDYEWEKIKNHISGVWNSSDIGLDLGNFIIRYRPWNTLDWILLPQEQLMTFSTPSLSLFLEETFCLMSSVMLLLVL